jgi:acyl carrier protein
MLNPTEVQTQVQAVIERITRTPITPEVKLIEKGIIDSIGMLNVILELEEVFQIQIDPFDMTPENFSSLPELTAFVLDRLSKL